MSKNHPPGHTWQRRAQRAIVAAIAVGTAGVFSIAVTETSEAQAQNYYGNRQRSEDRVIFRNPRYYGPNTQPATPYTQPGQQQGDSGNNPPSYGLGNPQAQAPNMDDYGDGNYRDGNLDTDNVGPSDDPNVYTNPTMNNRADVVPQVSITPSVNPNQNERSCMWTDGRWRPESVQNNSAFSNLADEQRLYCQGDGQQPYCWAMGFGVCAPDSYMPSAYGYYGYGDGGGFGPDGLNGDFAMNQRPGFGPEPGSSISITPAGAGPEPSAMGAGPAGPMQ
jgi:hypothetical protein